MTDQKIKCPECGADIPLSETLTHQIREGLEKDFNQKVIAKNQELHLREEDLIKEAKKVEESKKGIDALVAKKLEDEKKILINDAIEKAKLMVNLELRDLKEQNAEKAKQIEEASNAELTLRKKIRAIETKEKNINLEVARQVDQQKDQIKNEALEILSEDHRLKDLEKEKKMQDMQKLIDELKRKGEQGSVQLQGEVLEMDIEALLISLFSSDEIIPVPKGMKGADILQKIYTRSGQYCGTIIWESKRTKAWKNGWIAKLKEDQREVKADIAVIASEALPEDIKSFRQVDGVWITNLTLAGSLAQALRTSLVQVSQARTSVEGKNEKMEILYKYLSGPEFRQRVEGIADAFISLRKDLDKEKRSIMKMWAKREKEIEKAIMSTAKMYGDMHGIIGASLPEIKMLDLEDDEDFEERENS